MSTVLDRPLSEPLPVSPDWFGAWPLLFEEFEEDVSELTWHYYAASILFFSLQAHLAERHKNLLARVNFALRYAPPRYSAKRLPPSAVPDVMVVEPVVPLPEDKGSYRIGVDGPAPRLVIEVLSESTAEERDLDLKLTLYALLGISEYVLLDASGQFLPQRLLLKRLQRNGTYRDIQDADGGVTSRLGVRILLDDRGLPTVVDTVTGQAYLRTTDAQSRFNVAKEELDAATKALEAASKERDATAKALDAVTKERDELRSLLEEQESRKRKRHSGRRER